MDGEVNLMYLLFKYKGIMLFVFYCMLKGEKEIISIFMD